VGANVAFDSVENARDWIDPESIRWHEEQIYANLSCVFFSCF